MSIQSIIEGVIGREGRYSNNPADAGGETMYGITVAVARAAGYSGPMKDMPRDVAASIYLRDYVTAPGFHKVAALDMAISEELVDSGVNCGPALPAKWLQRTLNLLNKQGSIYPDLTVDGVLGNATMGALATVLSARGDDGRRVILRALNCLQGAHYFDITERRAANEEFFFGWILNRIA